MLIEHIADTRNGLTGTTTEEVSDLQKLYKESKARFDESEDFKARARAAVTRLQSGETEYLEVLCHRLDMYHTAGVPQPASFLQDCLPD